MQANKLNVAIPRGIRSGQHIRLVGQGRPGMGQGKAGDLYLEIELHTHAYYRVEQRDVYLDLPVAPWEAQLGATLQVPTPGGPDDFARLVKRFSARREASDSPLIVRALFALRLKLGKIFGWDKQEAGVGARVRSLRERLPPELREETSHGPGLDRGG